MSDRATTIRELGSAHATEIRKSADSVRLMPFPEAIARDPSCSTSVKNDFRLLLGQFVQDQHA
jgi:hypothetical protein